MKVSKHWTIGSGPVGLEVGGFLRIFEEDEVTLCKLMFAPAG